MKIERVVVTGGRNFTDAARIEADLRALLPLGLQRVAQGGNGIDKQFGGAEWPTTVKSADALAWLAAASLHLVEATYRVDRSLDGPWPAAGCRRNIRMLEAERPDLVLAYPDPESRGTWHCVREAIKRNITVIVWHDGVTVTRDHIDPTWTVFHAPTPAEIDKRAALLAPPPPRYPLDLYGADVPALMCALAGVRSGSGTIQRGVV